MRKVRVVVAGAGAFGRNHMRVARDCPGAELAGVIDTDPARAAAASAEFGCPILNVNEAAGRAEAAVVAVPTTAHAEVGCALIEAGLDVLVEKPIAPDPAAARRLIRAAEARGRLLQVGHLERFNPAVIALRKALTLPLFFEIHRLSVFSPRSLDVDVVRDLMIHDLDIVLALVGQDPEEIRAAGISILSQNVDIASARLAFPNGCIANLTASRVSTERVRKLRLFQPRQYIWLDYARQDAAVFEVGASNGMPQIGHRTLPVDKGEPLRLELESFIDAVRTRSTPAVTGEDGLRALEAALAVVDKIEEHARRVGHSLAVWKSNENCSPPEHA